MSVPGRLVGFGLVLASAWGVGFAVGAATRPLDDLAPPSSLVDGRATTPDLEKSIGEKMEGQG